MAYTVTKLITNAYYLSGIVARNLQTVTGDQIEDGLDLLNAVLEIKTAGIRLIPYYTQFDFTAVIGQEKYFIPDLISVETFTFFIGPVRYSMQQSMRKQYFGSPRVENIESLPYNWHIERCFGGANLYLYFVPNIAYPLEIMGKFRLSNVVLNQDLALTMDRFYIEYLRYALAEQICAEYNIPFQPQAQAKLEEYEHKVMDISPPDLSMTKMSSLQRDTALNFGDINLGLGWRPG